MNETMQAIVKPKPGPGVMWQSVPVPEPGPDDILVKVRATSICGTDAHIYNWDPWASERVKPPLVQGHEFAGEVVEFGSGVRDIRNGQLVAAESHVVCHHCHSCRTGQYHVCQNTKILGVDRDGCFAEYIVIPAWNAWAVPPGTPVHIATLMEPVGNAVFVVSEADVTGKSVAVLGCGPAGLAAVSVARAMGAASIVATDLRPIRRELAQKLGADLVLDPTQWDGIEGLPRSVAERGVDVVLEMSGNNAAIRQGLHMLRTEGRMIAFGLPGREITLNWGEDLIMKAITIRAVVGRRLWQTWYQLQDLLESGQLDLNSLITHRFSLTEFEKGMQAMVNGDSGKVVFSTEGVF